MNDAPVHDHDMDELPPQIDTELLVKPVFNHGFNLYAHEAVPQVEGMQMIEPNELFNLMMQREIHPCVADSNYLLLIGASHY